MTVANVSPRDLALLDVEEKGYRHSGPIPPLFVRTLNRQLGALKVTIKGCDTEPGGSLFMVIQDADQPVLAAPDEGPSGSPPPARLALRSAPNPFRGSTEFSFELAEPGPVRVRIYDLSGRLIQDLRVSERGTPGSYRVAWDGRNLEGHAVSGGVYLYVVRAGSASAQGKLARLR
jgi:hypothetical protein